MYRERRAPEVMLCQIIKISLSSLRDCRAALVSCGSSFALFGTTLQMAFRPPPREHNMDLCEGKQENIRSYPTLLEDGSPMDQHAERNEREERKQRKERKKQTEHEDHKDNKDREVHKKHKDH